MKKQIKRLALILPMVFTLLLSCVTAFSASADDPVDYSQYLLDSDGIEDFDTYFSADYIRQLYIDKYPNNSYLSSSFYFYSLYKTSSNYDSSHPYDFYFNILFFFINDDTPLFDNDYYIAFPCLTSGSNIYLPDYSLGGGGTSASGYLVYDKLTGQCFFVFSSSQLDNYRNAVSVVDPSYNYIYFQGTNIEDFPLADGVNQASSGLKVDVEFSPSLSGNVDSSLNFEGLKIDNPFFRFSVKNNGNSNIHYSMFIIEHGYDLGLILNARPYPVLQYTFSDSVKFALTLEEWHEVLGQDNLPTRAKGETFWQILQPGYNRSNFISWSQMQLLKNTDYDVAVFAYSSDLDYIPRFNTPEWEAPQGHIVEVYRSTFSLDTDTKYDPYDDSFGVTPYIPGKVFDNDKFSQYYDSDGNLQTGSFTTKDILNNSNQGNYISGAHGGSGGYRNGYYDSNGNYVSGSFNNLSSSISGFLSFFNTVFSYLPGNFTSLIGLSITSLVVIAIFKGVFR